MKYIIIVKGLAGEANIDCKDGYKEIDNTLLDGIDYHHETFHDWIDDLPRIKDHWENSYMEFNVEDGKLYTYVYYFSNIKLTDVELEILKEYTSGQLSDGIGEGFEQHPCTTLEINGEECEAYLSPWYYGQVLTITQEEYE